MRRTLLFLLLSASVAFSNPKWLGELSPPKVGPHPMISPSKLEFSLSWKGMLKAGVLDIEFAPKNANKPGLFVVKSSASSRGAAAALFPYNHSYWSEIHPASLLPRYFHSTENDSKESVTTTNRYTRSKILCTERTVDLKSASTKVENHTFPFGPARDVFSAMLHIRSQKLDVGDEHTLLLHPFRTPYLLNVRVLAKEKHLSRNCIRLSFSMRKIDRDTQNLVRYKKLKRPVTLWLSDDAERIPLELRAAVYIGDVRAILTSHTKTR